MRQATTPGLTTDIIMEKTIGDLRKSMEHVFEDISVDALVSAEETGTFTFTKGASKNFLYENLSAGEKAAFDLLLDIVVNKARFDDSLYCIDEPEAHLNTRVQRTLLKELWRLTPRNSQLWLATHSIGMVRAAQDIRAVHGEKVVFLDMGFVPTGRSGTTMNRRPSSPPIRITGSGSGTMLLHWTTWLNFWRPTTLSSARAPRKRAMQRLMRPATAGFFGKNSREPASFPSELHPVWRSEWESFSRYWIELSGRHK